MGNFSNHPETETPLRKIDDFLNRLDAFLKRLSPVGFVTIAPLAAMMLTVLFYTPRFRVWNGVYPHEFEWTRCLNFIVQCQDPFRAGVEPALRWRLLPALIGHLFHGDVALVLLVPLLGLVALLVYVTLTLERLTNRSNAFLGVLLLATTSTVITPVDWLGINDPWAWLCLLIVAFSPRRWTLVLACLTGPWIDERFILALPLALLIRHRDDNWRTHALSFLGVAALLLPYALARLEVVSSSTSVDHMFLLGALTIFRGWLPFLPLGWWLAYRGLWICILVACWHRPWRFGPVLLLTLAATGVLAADITRSAADVLPLAMLGLVLIHQKWPSRTGMLLTLLLGFQLLTPTAHLVAWRINPILPLPLERLFSFP